MKDCYRLYQTLKRESLVPLGTGKGVQCMPRIDDSATAAFQSGSEALQAVDSLSIYRKVQQVKNLVVIAMQ